MDKRLKKGLIIGSIVLLILIIGGFVANMVIKNKVIDALNNVSDAVKIEYKDIHVNTLTGSVRLIQPIISVYGKTTNNLNIAIALKALSIHDVSYWNYLFKDKITVERISIEEPNIVYHHNSVVTVESSQNSYKDAFKQTIEIQTMELNHGNVAVFDVATDSLLFKSEAIHFEIHDVAMDKTNQNPKMPVTFKDYRLTFEHLFYTLNDFESLSIEQGRFNTDFYKVENMVIKTQQSKEALSQQLTVERDHFDLTIDSVLIKNHDFGFKEDSLFYFKSPQVHFYQPQFTIYRDKLVADDPTYKPLYSKSIRELNFDLTLEQVLIHKASIVYLEKVKEDTQGGRLEFSNLNADITNLSNTYSSGTAKTAIHVDAIFMENTPLTVDWNFDVNASDDEFVFKADIGTLAASHMNQFMEPNVNLRLNGEIQKTYFTINGFEHNALIDLKLQYDNFDIVILKQNGKEKNKLLSGIINLFVSSDSNNKSNQFRQGRGTDIERDKTKSVFNYLWLNVKAGLLNAMTGDGQVNGSN